MSNSNFSILAAEEKLSSEDGFSLVEAVIAMVILLIVVSGVFATFAYAVNYNAGNNSRQQALAVLQQEVELMRSAKFTPTVTDAVLTGGTKATKIVTSADGYSFKVQTTVDDDPLSNGIQIDTTKTIKEITVTVTLNSPTPGWQTAIPATIVLRRVQAN
jgi:type II secretory pathway pseudopilin PulG